jgi:membrane protease YdiL (CAAX protease family)
MVLSIILSIIFLKILCKKIHRIELTDIGICKFSINLKWILCAILLPLLVILFFIILIPGYFKYDNINYTQLLNKIGFGILCIGMATGITEELWFRGYIMKMLEKNIDKNISIIITAIIFSFLHIINIRVEYNIFDVLLLTVNGIIVGIMFALIVYKSNSIWSAVIVHVFWNAITGGIIHIGINESETVLFNYILEKDLKIITGGSIGFEVSLPAMIGYIIIIIICINKKDVKMSNVA